MLFRSAPSAKQLVDAVRRAIAAVAPELGVVVVRPEHMRGTIASRPMLELPEHTAATCAAIAAATITVNHPAAAVALLAGAPVLHMGACLYSVRGIAHAATCADLPAVLAEALRRDHPALRQRFLTWTFRHGHVWCSPTHPDHNGMLGLVQAIETRLPKSAGPSSAGYRAGPAWPLTHASRT